MHHRSLVHKLIICSKQDNIFTQLVIVATLILFRNVSDF